MFQPPVPVARVLEKIHSNEYLLPAIQREFVWDTGQICVLFDSLMRGYPIGAFLLWQVDADRFQTLRSMTSLRTTTRRITRMPRLPTYLPATG